MLTPHEYFGTVKEKIKNDPATSIIHDEINYFKWKNKTSGQTNVYELCEEESNAFLSRFSWMEACMLLKGINLTSLYVYIRTKTEQYVLTINSQHDSGKASVILFPYMFWSKEADGFTHENISKHRFTENEKKQWKQVLEFFEHTLKKMSVYRLGFITGLYEYDGEPLTSMLEPSDEEVV